ncbi:hypothetical protein DL93DRAFT_813506 [Clavulina sp. PMI_390]|nr:hypothetical protein DL93DRAFT_813506 [Clavulina sp. PMI_390]
MTRWNQTIDNPSPLLTYSPEWMWQVVTNISDPEGYSQYSNGSTATTTSFVGAMVNFTFFGTGVWVYGAKRPNYAYYNVTLNGNKTSTFTAQSDNSVFGQALYGASNLPYGLHTLSIANAGSSPSTIMSGSNDTSIDIDWLVWETEYDGPGGPVNAQVSQVTFDNNHPRFLYTGSWSSQTNADGPSNGTDQYTTSSDASLQFTFDGDAIALYGSVGVDHGDFVANVDGMQSKTLSGHWNESGYMQMLYYVENLGAGTHNLNVDNKPTSSSEDGFNVDYVTTWTARGGSQSVAAAPEKKYVLHSQRSVDQSRLTFTSLLGVRLLQ